MKNYDSKHIKNIAITGHSGSGKTALCEALLYKAGATDRLGKTADGNKLVTQLRRYQMIFPHTSFVFCNQDQLCDTIMLALKRGSMISPHNP